ncbi:MAG: GAF domain-containing protein, partial [Anaerolineales bacterium]|nr:GAF domain-containing protein [Anaerolineales bacterium]MDW8448194.1 GAF domain-containing protein [Anaerolineales bacterium]
NREGYPTTQASLELLYNISRELTSALDLHLVLRRVLFLSMQSVGAINGSIIVLDSNGKPIDSAIITGDVVHDQTTQQLRITYEQGLAGWVAQHRQAVLIKDTSRDERWLKRPDDAPERRGPKSAVSAPLMVRDELVGVITLVHPQPGFFQPEHLSLVQSIADQAGIAVLNARLYEESQRRARIMAALASSAAAITGSLDLKEVLQRILEQTSRALLVDTVSLALIDPKRQELVFEASTGRYSEKVIGLRLKLGEGIAGWVAQRGEGTVVNDVSKDERFLRAVDLMTGFRTRAIACAPIRWGDEVIGVLEAINPQARVFNDDALDVLSGIASLAGTAIRHAQLFAALQAAHQRYLELFQDSIDAIFITDWEGRIIEANHQAERVTLLGAEALRGQLIHSLAIVNSQLLGDGFANLKHGETLSYETTLQTSAGRSMPAHVYARKVSIDEEECIQWIVHDITERKNLETLRADLISMIYHDLRSPLANVISSLDVLENILPADSDAAVKSLLKIAVRSTERIQRLVNALLDLRRLEAGRPISNPRPEAVEKIIADSVDAVRVGADAKHQAIETHLSALLPPVLVDGEMIRRVLINLLENAIKYTPQGSAITVGAQSEGKMVQIWVQDCGPGIPPSEQERIFDKFTRLRSANGQHGFGLGLAYCRLAVEAHGGRIWVESQPNQGACFRLTLPVASNGQRSNETQA